VDIGAQLGDLSGDLGSMLETLRLWTIAHEAGHQWWHVVVGNDSVLDPVVDDPLAQYSADIVLRERLGAQADDLCTAHIETGYEQMRAMGDQDGPAARATHEFVSSGQYAGVVDALGAVAEEHAFTMMTSADLRTAIGEQLDEPVGFDAM